jgi:hypothetical protein
MPRAPRRRSSRTTAKTSSHKKVSDTRSRKFAREAARQSRLVASSRHAAADQSFIDAISAEFGQ